MDINRRFPRKILFLLPLIFLLAAPGWFSSRAPVLLVTDAAFTSLYGSRRALLKRAEASLGLLRPVRPVVVAGAADEDLTVIAVEEAAATPFCVAFPYRFLAAALSYSKKHPEIPVRLLAARSRRESLKRESLPSNFLIVETDRYRDLYRAGKTAALLAGNRGGGVLVIEDGQAGESERSAFLSGLLEGGFDREPVYIPEPNENTLFQDYACAVLSGSGGAFFDQPRDMPLIIFSWIDPALTPGTVKLIFDDSPWAVLKDAVKMTSGPEGALPSKTIFPRGREEYGIRRKDLQKAVLGTR